MMVTIAAGSSKEVAEASSATALALVVVSSAQPTSSAAGRASSGLRLEEDVVLQFDATHHLSELTESWGRLAAGAASFGEKLQVVIYFFLCFCLPVLFYSLFSFPSFFYGSSLSSEITLVFFGLGETEKKLSFELSQLKGQLASKEVELDSE
jgi:hypothetical protein